MRRRPRVGKSHRRCQRRWPLVSAIDLSSESGSDNRLRNSTPQLWQFDIVHQTTFHTFRIPFLAAGWQECQRVWGPVAGGESCPPGFGPWRFHGGRRPRSQPKPDEPNRAGAARRSPFAARGKLDFCFQPHYVELFCPRGAANAGCAVVPPKSPCATICRPRLIGGAMTSGPLEIAFRRQLCRHALNSSGAGSTDARARIAVELDRSGRWRGPGGLEKGSSQPQPRRKNYFHGHDSARGHCPAIRKPRTYLYSRRCAIPAARVFWKPCPPACPWCVAIGLDPPKWLTRNPVSKCRWPVPLACHGGTGRRFPAALRRT